MRLKKKYIIVILLLGFLVFYIGYSFSDYGDVNYQPIKKNYLNITPDQDEYSPGQRVILEYETRSYGRDISLFRPLLKSELIISTDLKDTDTYLMDTDSKEKIYPADITTGIQDGIEYNKIIFNVPNENDRFFKLYLEGKITDFRKKPYLAFAVHRKHYLFESDDIYLGKVTRELK